MGKRLSIDFLITVLNKQTNLVEISLLYVMLTMLAFRTPCLHDLLLQVLSIKQNLILYAYMPSRLGGQRPLLTSPCWRDLTTPAIASLRNNRHCCKTE